MKRIAIQGIAGSFHEDAVRQYYDEEVEIVECKSFTRVCERIDSDEVEYAAMAIENSIAGSLLNNYQLIRDYHLKITGEIYIHIQMNLMSWDEVEKSAITDIYSHPIALKQCAEYIEKYFPNARLHEMSDTAASANLLPKNTLPGQQPLVTCVRPKYTGLKFWIPVSKPTRKTIPGFYFYPSMAFPAILPTRRPSVSR
jgi:prephenate dehydratase